MGAIILEIQSRTRTWRIKCSKVHEMSPLSCIDVLEDLWNWRCFSAISGLWSAKWFSIQVLNRICEERKFPNFSFIAWPFWNNFLVPVVCKVLRLFRETSRGLSGQYFSYSFFYFIEKTFTYLIKIFKELWSSSTFLLRLKIISLTKI